MMDDYRYELADDELQGDYASLADAREVMREVIGLVDGLRGSTKKLGDAIAASGFAAREWVGPDAALALLGEPFPDISLDAFLTRLAEFAAGMGPSWLRGGEEEIARFIEDVQLLNDVARPLRAFAQRQRMLPVRERGELPLELAFGDGRVGTQIDLVAGYLRDLDSLAPYIVPLTPSEWAAIQPPPPPSAMPEPPKQPAPASGAPSGVLVGQQEHWLLTSGKQQAVGKQAVGAYAAPQERASTPAAPPTYSRLRDYAPPASSLRASRAGASGEAPDEWQTVLRVPNGRGLLALLLRNKWMVLGITVLVLSAGTGLLSLAALRMASAPTAHLAATPTTLRLSCAGRGATATLTLRDTSTAPVSWTLSPPDAVHLSATRGTLKPGASATLTATSTSHTATQGVLTFTVDDGTLTVPYVISCR